MAGKFNMNSLGLGNGLLNSYSKELKEGFEIINIPIEQIDRNEKNNYSIENIDELIDSIRAVGLKQNLDVMKMPNGRYKILTGHRRFEAITELAKEDDKYKMVPCTVTEIGTVALPVSDDSKEKYLLHITNATQREMTDADKYNQYKDLVSIYTEAKNNGFTLSDKMRNLIANDMQLSAAQIGKMDYIRNNGTEELEQRIQSNEISISEANEIAHHEKEAQASLKPKKQRIIDTLDKESYELDGSCIQSITNKCLNLNALYKEALSNEKIVTKQDYAKIYEIRERIEKEYEKLEKIINK